MKFPGLNDKTALITGGGSGIGQATAALFAASDVRVVILDKDKSNTQKTIDTINSTNPKYAAAAFLADIANPASFKRAINKIEKYYTSLDIVFANAGINGTWAPVEDLRLEEWNETINTNLRGTFLTFKHTLPLLKNNMPNEGTRSFLINSSINGSRIFNTKGTTAYVCSKAGQIALAKHLALQYAKDRIRVNVICPGDTATNIGSNMNVRGVQHGERAIPLTNNAPGQPQDAASLAAFLSSDAASHISGTEIYIDGAESLLRSPE